MFKIKKWVILVCSAVAVTATVFSVFSMTGCGGKKKVVVAKFLSHMPEKDDSFQKLVKMFNEKNEKEGFKVELQSIGGGADYVANAQSKLNSGDLTAFMVQAMGEMYQFREYADAEALKNLSFLKKARKEILESYSDGANLCAVPVAIEYYGYLVWNDILKACGVDSTKVKTWDDLVAATDEINKRLKSGEIQKKFPSMKTSWISFLKDAWAFCNHTFHTVTQKEFGNELNALNSTDFEFKYADDFRKMVSFQTANSVPEKFGEPDQAGLNKLLAVDYSAAFDQAFLNKSAAIIQMGNWAFQQLTKVDPSLANVDIIPFIMPDGSEGKYVMFASQGFMVNKKASKEQKEVAAKFFEFMYAPENLKYLCESMNMISPYATIEELEQTKALNQIDMRALKDFREGKFMVGGCGLVRGEKLTMNVLQSGLQKWVAAGEPGDGFNKDVVEPVKVAWKEMAPKKQ